ncbi:hypothetical protein [Deinococcus sp. QL22]|uniref:hypothetical protein n=1 Tax=Deinococcus sp. QL22 TaxID=2939437 RepID=UPI0020172E47|nr:hypothetical protein [Deinococcus sp. QL22]UQN10663.1 hypothetical protein M1R55_30270 [Deinococcus sp. QL22]
MIEDLNKSTVAALSAAVAPFRVAGLLPVLAGLQLLPENASVVLRLEALVQVTLLNAPGGNTTLKRPQLEHLVNAVITETEIPMLEDPQAYPFIENLAFHGGNYFLINGVFDGSSSRARLMARILARLHATVKANDPARSTIDLALEVFLSALMLGDEVASRARLTPQTRQPEIDGFFLPSPAMLSRLQSAVSFTPTELTALLAPQRLKPQILEPLIGYRLSSQGTKRAIPQPSLMTPLVQLDQRLIVSVPSALLPAACHQVISLFHRAGHIEKLMQAYSAEAWNTLEDSLQLLGYRSALPLSANPYGVLSRAELRRVRCGMYTFDTDKVLLAVLVTDDLHDYDPTAFMGDTGQPLDLDAFCQGAIENLYMGKAAPNEILVLIVHHTLSDGALISVSDFAPTAFTLLLGNDDLNLIADLENGKRLRLYKFAKALHEVRQSARLPLVDTLDIYAFYRDHRYSFYLSDHHQYHGISVQPGYARSLREEVQQRWQRHLVPAPDLRSLVEVGNFHQREDCLMYAPFSPVQGRFGIYIESIGLPVWVLTDSLESVHENGLGDTSFYLAQMLGFWMWQFAPLLKRWLAQARVPMIRISLRLSPLKGWQEQASVAAPLNGSESPPFTIQARGNGMDIDVILHPAFHFLVATPDNAGERVLIEELLTKLHSLVVGRTVATDELAQAMETIAPLGLKKSFLALNTQNRPELAEGDLPKARTVQKEDQDIVLERLAQGPLAGRQPGEVLDKNRTKLLNSLVGDIYNRLAALVATLRGDELRHQLIAHHESLVKDATFYNVTLPTQSACYASNQQVTEEMSEQMRAYATASLCSRFLIEYVAACPPAGLRPFSLSAYDELMALGSELIGMAHQSDYIQYGLVNLPVSILGSGRIGVNTDELAAVMQGYRSTFDQGELARATGALGQLWEVAPAAPEPGTYADFNAAVQIELGFTLPELMDFREAAYLLAAGQVYSSELGEFLAHMATTLGWPTDRVRAVLEHLSLNERDHFLKPPAPYDPIDTYPWLFNRRLSFLQKPYLRHGTRITYGPRSVHQAARHLVTLLLGGRFRAASPELKRQYGIQTNRRGERFNQQIADLLKRAGYDEVKPKVGKIGGRKLASATGNDLGDIDVLVIDRSNHRILLLECKDLSSAKTPTELHMEVQNVLVGTERKKSLVLRHQHRAEWFRENWEFVLQAVNADEIDRWRLVPLLVVDTELMVGHLRASPLPIVPEHQLVSYLQEI